MEVPNTLDTAALFVKRLLQGT